MQNLPEGPEARSEARPDAEDAHQAALLIDFDNVTMGIRSNLGQELRNLLNSDVMKGRLAVQRAYADWRRYPQYIVPLSEASIDLIFAPAYGSSKKNATDIRLAIDALELVFTRPEIRTFILMSGDSDFSSMVLKLKEYGKYVIGVGIQESSSDLLVQNCDEYYSYSALSGLSRAGQDTGERHDPWVLAEKAVLKMVERGDTMRSDRLKQVMLEIDSNFSEKEQGFNKFNRFVVEAASRGLLSIQKMQNGQYGVGPGDKLPGGASAAAPKKEAKAEGRRSAGRRGRGKGRDQREGGARASAGDQTRQERAKLTMKSALALLDRALGILLQGRSGPVRDSDVKRRILELDNDFDEGELGFSKFSKFLQAAEEAGAVQLSRDPNGNYRVERPSGEGIRRDKKATGAPSEGAAPQESTVKRIARFLFGGEQRQTGGGAPERRAKPGSARASSEKPGAATRPTAQSAGGGTTRREGTARDSGAKKGPRGPRAPRARPAGTSERRAPQGARPRADSAAEPRAEKRRRAEPRGRREESADATAPSKVGQSAEAAPEKMVPTADAKSLTQQPAAASRAAEARASSGREPTAPGTAALTPAQQTGAPRGTIRGRWGTRGRYRPAAAPPPLFEGQIAGGAGGAARRDEPTAPRRSAAATDAATLAATLKDTQTIVSHLKTRYAGVGAKTAETLAEAFGPDVFRILDDEPERVRALLPDRRAERVIAARREEREAGGK